MLLYSARGQQLQNYIKVHMATRWAIRLGSMPLWFTDLMNVTEEVTIHHQFQLYGWLGMCFPIKLNFLFCERKPLFDALCTTLTFGLSNVFVVFRGDIECQLQKSSYN